MVLLFVPLSLAQSSSPVSATLPAGGTASAQTATQATSRRSTGKPAKKSQQEPEAVQTPPPPPPTPEQLPPAQPVVSYQNGELTILSQNSTLAQVLRSVQSKTGASVEIPGSANNERVVAQLGPGQPRDVLNSLLTGSKFDYIILGVADKPGAVQKVILTPRQNAATVNSAQSASSPHPTPAAVPEQEEAQPEDDTNYVTESQPEEPPADQNGQQQATPAFVPSQPIQPVTQPDGTAPATPQGVAQPGGPQGVKTPEQLLQELQRLHQQQQQYQQQLNPANQPQSEQPQQ